MEGVPGRDGAGDMRGLAVALLLLTASAGANPQGEGDPVLSLIRRAETLWAYFPLLTDQAAAEELVARVRQGKQTLILFAQEDLQRHNSYSLYLYLLQIRHPNLEVRFARIQNPGEEAILIGRTGRGKEVLLGKRAASEEEGERASRWWGQAWRRSTRGDPLEVARRIFLGGEPRIGP